MLAAIPGNAAAQAVPLPTAPRAAASATGPDYLQVGLGVDYSEGKYGDVAKTKVTSVPVAVKYVKGAWIVRLSVPYVYLSGPGALIGDTESAAGGAGISGSGGSWPGGTGSGVSGSGTVIPGGDSRRVDGFGDVITSLTYGIDLIPDSLFLDLTGKVKIPTASTRKRLGSGKTDLVAAATLSKQIGAFNLYAEGRHRFAGRSDAFPLRDTWGVSTGVAARVAKPLSLGLDYNWQQSSFRGNGPSSELTASATYRLSRALRLQIYGITGLSRNSADAGGGAQLLWRFYT